MYSNVKMQALEARNDKANNQAHPYIYSTSSLQPHGSQVQQMQRSHTVAGVIAPIPSALRTWMPRPKPITGVPTGLEYLADLDQLLVHQEVQPFEAYAGIEMANSYEIKNFISQHCYYAYEKSGYFNRICWRNARGFDMHIVDYLGQEVIHARRDHRFCVGISCCIRGDYCAFTLNVDSPTGVPIGRIVQARSSWKPKYAIENAEGETILVIKGPCCVCSGVCCPCDVIMKIYTSDESYCIREFTTQYSGFAKELLTKATNFGITFPKDLDIKAKALLVAAAFLIDMMYFEY